MGGLTEPPVEAGDPIERRSSMVRHSTPGQWRGLATLVAVVALIAGACSSGGASTAPSAAAPSAAPPASVAASAAASAAASGTGSVHVSIVNKDMTADEVKAAVKAEGGLTVGNWTYAATDELVKQFQDYVKKTYDADIKLTYAGTQAPSEYITKLAAAKQAGNPAPYDVIAVEENYWYDASQQGLVDDVLPSGLIPNQSLVLEGFQHVPQSIAFQSTAYPGVVYNKKTASSLKTLKDLANSALKGKITLPAPGDITAGGMLLGFAAELGKDYKDPNQMKEVVDWVIANVGPNVIQYTTDQPTLQGLFESGQADAVFFWNSLARLEYLSNHPDAALLVPATIYPANGYLWVPKGAAHPVLAQIFMNWRLAPDVQFPNDWPIEHGPWSELSEGFLGQEYVSHVPDWFKADYPTYYPTLDQIQSSFKSIDWKAYNDSAKVFQDYYKQKIGQ
jgi:ABC-type thiamine transport system substrate-binding protein